MRDRTSTAFVSFFFFIVFNREFETSWEFVFRHVSEKYKTVKMQNLIFKHLLKSIKITPWFIYMNKNK